MTIQLGSTNITKAYLGSTEITKAYLGGVVVFEESGYPLENIISEYKFQNNTLDTVGSNDGTATALTYTAGLVGQTGVFDGSTGKVVIAYDPSLSFILVPFSVTFLVNFTSTARAFLISKRKTSSSNVEYQITYNSGEFTFAIFGGGTNASFMATRHTLTPTLGQWYHITVTYNGGTNLNDIKFYFDAVDVGVNDQNGTFTGMGNTTSDVWFGQATFIGSYDFNGDMDCIRFWDKELTSDEVLSIATAELNGIDINNGTPILDENNLITVPYHFTDALWGKGNCTTTVNNIANPYTQTANLVEVKSQGTGSVFILWNNYTFSIGTQYTATVWLKNTNLVQWVRIGHISSANTAAWYDLDNGVLGIVRTGESATITDDSDGWYKITLTFTATSNSGSRLFLGLCSGDGSTSFSPLNSTVSVRAFELVQG